MAPVTGNCDTNAADDKHRKVVRHRHAAVALRDHFLKWQCRARQNAVRKSAGKPSESMCPGVIVDELRLARIVLLINRHEHCSAVPEFRHMVLRTHDPKKRLDGALVFLAAEYYQREREFTDHLTALFGPDDRLVETLKERRACTLAFDQTRQHFSLPCEVVGLDPDSYLYQATYWHNRLFNPAMPPGVQVLAFRPDWSQADASPAPS